MPRCFVFAPKMFCLWAPPPSALLLLSHPGGVLGATTTSAASAITPRRGLGHFLPVDAAPPPALLTPRRGLGHFLPVNTAFTAGAAPAVTPAPVVVAVSTGRKCPRPRLGVTAGVAPAVVSVSTRKKCPRPPPGSDSRSSACGGGAQDPTWE